MIDICMKMNTENPAINYVDLLDITINGISIKLDDEFLGYVIGFLYDCLEHT